jgi:hypothetical protein
MRSFLTRAATAARGAWCGLGENPQLPCLVQVRQDIVQHDPQVPLALPVRAVPALQGPPSHHSYAVGAQPRVQGLQVRVPQAIVHQGDVDLGGLAREACPEHHLHTLHRHLVHDSQRGGR